MAQASNPQTNYFSSGNIEFRYMEIGIALTTIDRMNPGTIPFVIPSLMPKEDKVDVKDRKIVQNSKSNLMTENAGAVDVSTFEVSNAIYITIPRELTGLPGAVYDFEGTATYTGAGGNGDNIDIDSSNMEGYGTVSETLGYINVNGHTTGTIASYGYYMGNIKGTANFTLNNVNRYIEKNSRWLIAFIGGDISMPAVVCRLPDDIDHVEYEYVPIG